MINYQDSQSLLSASQNENLYDTLVSQLVKDFGLANITIDIPFKVSPKNLKTILHQKIYRLMMERFTEYLNLLYIVDIPETTIKNIEGEDVVEIADQVSFLILKREFQKVWFRNKYSS